MFSQTITKPHSSEIFSQSQNNLPWFAASVRDIRMLRIEELNDLMPAIQQGGSR